MSEPKVNTSTYDIRIGKRTVSLRITVAAQIKLKNKFHNEAIDTILEAANDLDKLLAVFDEALSFKGNENDNMTGEELYDALVDSGIKGTDAFANILFEIANASGILSDKQKEQVSAGIGRSYRAIFENIEKGTSVTEDTESSETEEKKTVSFPEQ